MACQLHCLSNAASSLFQQRYESSGHCFGSIPTKMKLERNGLGDIGDRTRDAARRVQMSNAGRGKGNAETRSHRREHGLHRVGVRDRLRGKAGAQAGADNLIEEPRCTFTLEQNERICRQG